MFLFYGFQGVFKDTGSMPKSKIQKVRGQCMSIVKSGN